MDPIVIALLIVVIGLALLCGWLWADRSRLQKRADEAAHQTPEAAQRLADAEKRIADERARAEQATERWRADTDEAQRQITELRVEIARLMELQKASEAARRQEIEAHTKIFSERERALTDRETTLRAEIERLQIRSLETFEALSSKALKGSTDEFLKLAAQRFTTAQQQGEAALDQRKATFDALVKPIAEALARQDQRLTDIARQWGESRAGLVENLKGIGEAQAGLRTETNRLVRALREPHVRGHYGEITLRRVAELAGMSSYCDYSTQESTRDTDGRLLRPDMVVRLPNERQVAVDAKTNIRAYLDAIESEGDAQAAHLDKFASDVARQAVELGRKGYWKQFENAPEFVVMFIPGEQFIDAALQRRPTLLEEAAAANVIIAGPATLIALLRAVAVGWSEHRLAQEARALMSLGKELHERAAVALEHTSSLGKAINAAVDRYNKLAGSLEQRLLPTIRKFEDAGAGSGRRIDDPSLIEVRTRPTMLDTDSSQD